MEVKLKSIYKGLNEAQLVETCLKTVASNKGSISWSDFSSILIQKFSLGENLLRSVFDKCSENQQLFLNQLLERLSSDDSDPFMQVRHALYSSGCVKSKNVINKESSQVSYDYNLVLSPSIKRIPHTSSFPLTDICEDEIPSSDESVYKSRSYRVDLKNLSSGSWNLSEEAADKSAQDT
jgi:hypothetical protein